MAKVLQHRRDTTANLSSVSGAIGEFFMDTTKNTLVVMDGSTNGGHPLALETSLNTKQDTLVSGTSIKTINGTSLLGSGNITISGGGGDLSAVAEDILPSFDAVYDLGSATNQWYDVFVSNSVIIGGGSLSGNEAGLVTDTILVGELLTTLNTITPDASSAIQYGGDQGAVEIIGNLDVSAGDWMFTPIVETVNSVPPLTTGYEGMMRYNKDSGRFEGYNVEGWASLGGLETNEAGQNVVTGDLLVTGDVISNSDASLKDNIEEIKGALDIVTNLSGKLFTMKSDESQKQKVGFIAQEIEEHLPQVVSTDPDGIKSVAYGNITALLVEAIKELNTKIDNLNK